MRFSVPDKYEIVKAAARATDLESFKQWVISLVDAVDNLPEGRSDAPVPRYTPPAVSHAAVRPAAQDWAHDYLTPNGAPQRQPERAL